MHARNHAFVRFVARRTPSFCGMFCQNGARPSVQQRMDFPGNVVAWFAALARDLVTVIVGPETPNDYVLSPERRQQQQQDGE